MSLKKVGFLSGVFLVFCGIFYCFSYASFNQIIFPFAFSFMFALLWVNQKTWLVCPAFLIGSVLFDWSFQNVISSLVCCLVVLVPYYIHVLLKKNIKIWEMGIYCAVSQLFNILYTYFMGGVYYSYIISMVVGVLFMFCAIVILEAVLVRGFAYKLTIWEKVCSGVLLAVFSCGLTFLDVGPFSFLKFFAGLLILICGYCFSTQQTVLLAVLLASGSLIGTNNPVFFAPFVLWAIAVSVIRIHKKALMPVALVLIEGCLGYYFKTYYGFAPWEFSSVVASCAMFVCVPSGVYNKITSFFETKNNRTAVKDVVNRNRDVLQRRLSSLSEVFGDMNRIFKNMVRKGLSKNELSGQIKKELRQKVCASCSERHHCERAYSQEIDSIFEELSAVAFQKGKVSVLDIPNFLNAHCNKITQVISQTNTVCQQFKRYSSLVETVDTSKLLIADQMGGISQILFNLSKEVGGSLSFDSGRENRIIDDLLFHEIVCDDVLVYESDASSVLVSLVVRNEDKSKVVIGNVVGKVCGVNMVVNDEISSKKPGWTTLNFKNSPKFDCSFGLSACSKSGVDKSGDCHSVIRLEDNKFLFALCDGMGSGEVACRASENAVSLVENFYKAGFESELVLSNVNKLLTLQKEEVFSAIDICVLNLQNGVCDIVKMGSPSNFLISKDDCKIIEGGALPLGIVEEGNPLIRKIITSCGDFVIFVSDGISDAFNSDDDFLSFVCSLKEKNPQTLSDKILNKALSLNQGLAKDDMTALVIKVF